MSPIAKNLDNIHPAVWRASQFARAEGKTVDTGYAALSAALPGGGWPVGSLIELLLAHPGIGEIRLLRPALAALNRPIALVRPPYVPNALGFAHQGIPLERLMLLRTEKIADALWSAEQILRSGSCGALLFWPGSIRAESLRRLHLAAQSSDSLLVLFRPLAAASDSSPAALRLGVRPAREGIVIDLIKRRGPSSDTPLSIALRPSPVLLSPYGRIRRYSSTPAAARSVPTALVE